MPRLYTYYTCDFKWWERLALWFIKPQYSTDIGVSKHVVVYKIWRGKMYLIEEAQNG